MPTSHYFLLFLAIICLACAPTKVALDLKSDQMISDVNREMNVKKTKVYLKERRVLTKGEFVLRSDSLLQINGDEIQRFGIDEIYAIKTVGNHSSTTILSVGMIGAGAAIFATTLKDYSDQYPTPNTPDESRSESLTDTFKGNFLGSLLTISGLIILIGGIRQVTTWYEF
ncbi:MAG: hypothetical protein NXI08_05435 [bacterium]|nr:hypothetical protein [bacterium]